MCAIPAEGCAIGLQAAVPPAGAAPSFADLYSVEFKDVREAEPMPGAPVVPARSLDPAPLPALSTLATALPRRSSSFTNPFADIAKVCPCPCFSVCSPQAAGQLKGGCTRQHAECQARHKQLPPRLTAGSAQDREDGLFADLFARRSSFLSLPPSLTALEQHSAPAGPESSTAPLPCSRAPSDSLVRRCHRLSLGPASSSMEQLVLRGLL